MQIDTVASSELSDLKHWELHLLPSRKSSRKYCGIIDHAAQKSPAIKTYHHDTSFPWDKLSALSCDTGIE
jgi:hypothetical protein